MSSPSPSLVYHYTDTGRLPWILNSGLLAPGRNQIGGFPDPDFLWATTSPDGDGSASASREAFRSGLTQMVRFVLRADDFEPWPAVVERFPQWTPDHVARLEIAARGKSSPATWRCRSEPLQQSRWLDIQSRTYQSRTWASVGGRTTVQVDGNSASLRLGDWVYVSTKFDHPSGAKGYSVSSGIAVGAELAFGNGGMR
jgi:hypothetical protein